ncbi:MAG: baseplate J protein [Oleibacter sp.]|nr:baseplate J protein [Thalassolituus sp.]
MAFDIPTLSTLKTRIAADIERHSGESASVRGDIYYPLTQAHAAACYGLYKQQGWLTDQLFDDSCDDENLLRRAAEMNINQIPAYRASGSAVIPATDDTLIAAGTVFTKGDQAYRSTAVTTATGGSATVLLQAVEPGAAANLSAGDTLNVARTISGADTVATVIEMTGGTDTEKVSRVRERLQDRRQNPPMGGNANDYVQWAKAAHSDVTRAWCYSNENGPGTVVVRFVTDNLASKIPTAAHIEAVENYIDTVRPAGMAGFAVGPIASKQVNITFSRLIPDTGTVRASVEAELTDFINRESTPGGTLLLSKINEAISTAAGEEDHAITLTADVTSAANELIEIGTIYWP